MKKQDTFHSMNVMEINSELYTTPKSMIKEAKTPINIASQSISEEYPIMQDTMNKYQSLFVAFNLLLGVGPLIIPNSYLQAGVLFSTLFLTFMAVVAYTSTEYIIEAIGICNFITKSRKESALLYLNQFGDAQQQEQQNYPNDNITVHNININTTTSKNRKTNGINANDLESKKRLSSKRKEIKMKFHMDQKFELGEIADVLWGKEGQVVISMMVIIYLLGNSIAKAISISRIMKTTFSDVYIFDNFFFWLGLIFLFASLFSFKNVSSFAWIQEYIAVIRMLAIYSLIIGFAYEVYRSGYKGIEFEEYPLVNLTHFQCLFSNIILAFCFHHSIPAFVKPITPQKEVKWVIRITFLLGFFIFLSISYCGVSAFGTQIINLSDVHFISDNFKVNEPIIYYLSALYLFLNVIAFPVLVITCRNNLMKLIAPSKIPQISSEVTPYTFCFTIAILFTVALVSSIATNIQFVLNFIGGTLGVMIVFVAPTLYVINGRNILRQQYKVNYKLNRYCSTFSNQYLPYFILILGISSFLYNSYNLTK